MSVHVSPSGTRGGRMPRLPGPLMRLMNDAVFRVFRNRRFVMGGHVLSLTTIGAKTGQPRRTTVAYFADPTRPDAWLVVGSAGGAAAHPAWVHNIVRHPDQVSIEVGNRKVQVRAESITGEAREQAWRRIVAEAPSFANYPLKTDREIPVIRLTPR